MKKRLLAVAVATMMAMMSFSAYAQEANVTQLEETEEEKNDMAPQMKAYIFYKM